jgi:hypothetical protein
MEVCTRKDPILRISPYTAAIPLIVLLTPRGLHSLVHEAALEFGESIGRLLDDGLQVWRYMSIVHISNHTYVGQLHRK